MVAETVWHPLKHNAVILLNNMETNPTVYQIVKDAILLLFAGIGSYSAFYGLKAWRKQLKGKTEYELARRILLSVYKIRDGIKMVRHPFMSGGEIYEAKKKYKEQNPEINLTEKEIENYAVYENRWKAINEAFSSLNVDLLEAEVMWGNIFKDDLHSLNRLSIKLMVAIRHYLKYHFQSYMSERDTEKYEEYELLVYDHSSENEEDEFGIKINNVVSRFEQKLKKYLK